tara:strand:- start:169 stop:714 length:546 start_codon:yes stop_codon:yes gene_type:complete
MDKPKPGMSITPAKYYTYDYQHASNLNPLLHNIILDNIHHNVMGGGSITPMDLHTRGVVEVDTLIKWITGIIPDVAYKIISDGEDAGGYGFNANSFKINECWGIYYNKGQQVVQHNHFPYTLSFCYCVSAPPKSSPFILEGESITPIPGRVIFFLSHKYHGTLPSEVDGRCVITGNILYVP